MELSCVPDTVNLSKALPDVPLVPCVPLLPLVPVVPDVPLVPVVPDVPVVPLLPLVPFWLTTIPPNNFKISVDVGAGTVLLMVNVNPLMV